MTHSAVHASTPTVRPWYRGIGTVPGIVGLGFVASWIVGLSVSTVSTAPHATGAQVITQYAGHEGIGLVQFLCTEGLPAVGLAVVTAAVGRAAGGRYGRLVRGTGLAAAALSLLMFGLGAVLTLWAVPGGHVAAAGALNDAVSRVDGVKMLLLGAVGAGAVGLAGRGLPRWLAYVGAALAVTMAVTAVGYLFLLGGPAQVAVVSLPLLLVFVAAAGIVTGRR
ncbi:hypothetical protein [Actinocatenispora rupis]|uniref:DUF4386 domain-containing protein n=1 Tax=Actinocatenispora rupis TaxID=519421 RepID=A0A8J3JD12_9ACTN|nr:hypothetical protein [Actinocatenispora rupis]GID14484.1 hypothetical protein Aru02nite_53730 [Actinocatenispora rupis]